MAAVWEESCSFCHLCMHVLLLSNPVTVLKSAPRLWVMISNLVPFCFVCGVFVL